MAKSHLKLSTTVAENFENHLSKVVKMHFESSTVVGKVLETTLSFYRKYSLKNFVLSSGQTNVMTKNMSRPRSPMLVQKGKNKTPFAWDI